MLIQSKTTIPAVRTGTVRRQTLIERLLESHGVRLVSVVAPGGYGKSIALAQWAREDPRSFAWLTAESTDTDPVLLIRNVLGSLREAGIVETNEARLSSALVPLVCNSLSQTDEPFVLVIDDAHLLTGESLDVLGLLARSIPHGSQLAFCGRADVRPLVTRARSRSDVLELGPRELALDDAEAAELLAFAGIELTEDAAREFNRRVEGWAAALYLCMLAARETGALPNVDGTSIDRFVDDYVEAEHLSGLSSRVRTFLIESSALVTMCPELCDAVLGRHDSRELLEEIERSNLLLVPLDHERVWFRYHDLFRAALLRQLDRTDPKTRARLCLRAADWCQAQPMLEDAMRYALAADDLDRAAGLLTVVAFPLYRGGRMATLEEWLTRFDDPETMSRYPALAVLASIVHALGGRAFQAERWADGAARAIHDDLPLLDGSPSALPWIATAEALLCRRGPEQMQRDAETALADLGPLSPLRSPAKWLLATSYLIRGDLGEADVRLAEAIEAAEATGATFAWVAAIGQQALIALDRGDDASARALVERAKPTVTAVEFHAYVGLALVTAAEVRLDLRAGDVDRARAGLATCQRLRPLLTRAFPYYSVQTLTEMARAYLELGDIADARAVLFDASEILRERPDLGVLGDDVTQLSLRATTGFEPVESGLTTAELRLLPLLTTHLTFREIGERLHLSPNTVKTQAISIYRKLDATSRSAAVQRASELGFVDSVHYTQ
jgi:LuxR family transcriptional regulator, maltose regulon positive regulatory protein